jgi:threonyl-tRNA synthetase
MPKGALIRGVIENFLKDELFRRGYLPVYTPHIGKIELYQTSGHYPYYRDSQFPTLKMPSHPAAKELLDGLISGNLPDEAQRLLLAKAVSLSAARAPGPRPKATSSPATKSTSR